MTASRTATALLRPSHVASALILDAWDTLVDPSQETRSDICDLLTQILNDEPVSSFWFFFVEGSPYLSLK